MQTSGGVDEHHVGVSGLGGRQGVKYHSGRIGALALLDDLHPAALRPDGELLGGGSAEGIGSSKDNLLALLIQIMADLADGGGLAHAVYADEQHDGGLGGKIKLQIAYGEHLGEDLLHAVAGTLSVLDAALLRAPAQLVHRLHGGVHAHVGQDQRLLQLVIKLVSQLGEAIENADLFDFIEKTHGVAPSFILCAVLFPRRSG